MSIDRETVRKVAHLARLDLDDSSLEKFQVQLGAILHYIDQLSALDLTSVEPLVHAGDTSNVLRDDVPCPSLPTEAALSNAPERAGPCFSVPKVVE